MTTAHIEVAGLQHGPTLLLVHGAGINRKMWMPQVTHLGDRYRIVTVDLPGHGALRHEKFTFDRCVEITVDAVEQHTAGPAVLVGLSLGGYVALATAHDRIAALVLSGASVDYTGWGGLSTKLYGWALTPIVPMLRKANEKSLRTALDPDLSEAIISHGTSMRSAARALRAVPGRDYRGMLAGFDGPVLLLNGERDKPNRAEETEAAGIARDATIATVEDAGHACALTQPVAFAKAVDRFCRNTVGFR